MLVLDQSKNSWHISSMVSFWQLCWGLLETWAAGWTVYESSWLVLNFSQNPAFLTVFYSAILLIATISFCCGSRSLIWSLAAYHEQHHDNIENHDVLPDQDNDIDGKIDSRGDRHDGSVGELSLEVRI